MNPEVRSLRIWRTDDTYVTTEPSGEARPRLSLWKEKKMSMKK